MQSLFRAWKIYELSNICIVNGKITKNRGEKNNTTINIFNKMKNYNDVFIKNDNNIVIYASNEKYEIYKKIAIELKKINKDINIAIFKKPKQKKNMITTLLCDDVKFDVEIKIRGRRTTVKLSNGTKGSVYCNSNDTYNEDEGIDRAFKKALINQLLKEISK